MMIPIRCFSCGKLISDKWDEYMKRVKSGERPEKVLDDLDIKRYCCRRMFISHLDLLSEFLKYTEVAASRKTNLNAT